MLQHAAYWNYLWCRKPTRKETTLFRQSPRVKALQGMPKRFVKRLDAEEDVISVLMSSEGVVKVSYAAAAEIPFSEAAARCMRDVLKRDLDSDDRLLEYWMLCNGMIENIEVTYVSGGCNLLKQTFRFSSLVMHMNDSSISEAMPPAEIAFDEKNIGSLEEAVSSFRAALETGKRLLGCVLEIDEAIAARNSRKTNSTKDIWSEWRDTASEEISKLLAQLNNILRMYPDDFEGCATLVDEFKSSIHDVMNAKT